MLNGLLIVVLHPAYFICISGSRFFRSRGFLGSRSRVRVQVLEVANFPLSSKCFCMFLIDMFFKRLSRCFRGIFFRAEDVKSFTQIWETLIQTISYRFLFFNYYMVIMEHNSVCGLLLLEKLNIAIDTNVAICYDH